MELLCSQTVPSLLHQSSFFINTTFICLNMSFVLHLFLRLRIDLSLFQFLSPKLSFVYCSYFTFFLTIYLFSGRLRISLQLLLPQPRSQASPVLCSSVFVQYNTRKRKSAKNGRTLPLPCIILNENRRTQNGGGLGTRLLLPDLNAYSVLH